MGIVRKKQSASIFELIGMPKLKEALPLVGGCCGIYCRNLCKAAEVLVSASHHLDRGVL